MSRDEDMESVLTVAAYAPAVIIRVGISFLKLKRRANKAAKCFYKELLKNGIPPREARKLADDYTSVVSVRYWAKNLGGFTNFGEIFRSAKP
ncbi:MAG: hypothetical protein GKC03_01260 [Methanomassiliicoccales archaeon]|nr:hypothetical protein [Methanomassiliicoccales archaeon]NYT14424.1 hypothetical protein [Methanomassiliicoccales archaeon]